MTEFKYVSGWFVNLAQTPNWQFSLIADHIQSTGFPHWNPELQTHLLLVMEPPGLTCSVFVWDVFSMINICMGVYLGI